MRYIYLLLLLFLNTLAIGQHIIPCGTDILHHKSVENDVYRQKEKTLELNISSFFKKSNIHNRHHQIITLPVVVHIIHNNGAENISDLAVIQGIQDLNQAFANTGYYDQDNGVNTMIQFCLASRTPQGNATTGITRDQNALTDMILETQDISLKDINRWDPYQYINIWLVASITSQSSGPGVAGYAYFPASHGMPEDGIVIESQYMGSSPAQSGVLVHEMGHYLGLYHTFEGGCTNDDCLTDGDRVCDTPPDQSTAWTPCSIPVNTCPTDMNSGFTDDQSDMIINYMDYTDFNCFNAFTMGQADRMDWHINQIRYSLLSSLACNDPCLLPVTASFFPNPGIVDVGQTLNFINNSVNGTQFEWQVNGVNLANTPNFSYTFDNTGIYTLTLLAYNADPNCLDTFTTAVFVSCDIVAGFTSTVSGNSISLNNTTSGNATGYSWSIYDGTTTTIISNSPGPLSVNFPAGADIVSICLTAENPYCQNQQCQYIYAEVDTANCDPTFIRTYSWSGGSVQLLDLRATAGGTLVFAGRTDAGSNTDALAGKMDSAGNLIWVNKYSSGGIDFFSRIKEAANGDLLAVGVTNGITQDGWLTRFDASGNTIWSKRFDSGSLDYSVDIQELPGGDLLILSTMQNYSNVLISRLTANGLPVWEKTYVFGYAYTMSLAADGNVLLSGASTTFGFGQNDGWIMKINSSDGSFQWLRAIGQPQNDGIDFIMTASDGGILMAQNWHDAPGTYDLLVHKADMNGNLLWSTLLDGLNGEIRCYSGLEEADGSFLLALQDYSLPENMKVVRINAGGGVTWSKSFDPALTDYSRAIQPLPGGGYILGGVADGDKIAIARMDANGNSGGCVSGTPVFANTPPSIQTSTQNFTPANAAWSSNYSFTTENILLTTLNVCQNPCLTEICDNGLDDDGDNLFDCLDDDCPCSDCDPGHARNWCFGNHVGLDFNTEPPTAFNTPQVVTYEGVASIADANGTLLFYSDGIHVWNRNHLQMPNGFGLSGHPSSTQSAVIVPRPGYAHQFYLFTVDYGDGTGGLRYSLIDMSLDSGYGDIVSGQKNLSLWSAAEEKLNAVKHCNQEDIWVVTHDQTDEYRAYLITSAGVSLTPVITHIGTNIGISTAGYLKFSPNGKMIATAIWNPGKLDLLDFDNNTGSISNLRVIQSPAMGSQYYGVEFSPDSRLLYISSLQAPSRLAQYDLTAGGGNINAINNSGIILATHPSEYYFGGIQLAPNGKIYVTNSGPLVFGPSLGIINAPNVAGAGCNYAGEALDLGTGGVNLGLPTFIQSYFSDEAVMITGADSICTVPATETYHLIGVSCATESVAWQLDGILQASVADSIILNLSTPGTYILTAYAANECGNYADTMFITVQDASPVLDLGPDISVCENGVLVLDAGAGFAEYRWQNGTSDATFTASGPGIYWVDVWDICGNHQSDTVFISLANETVLNLGADRVICRGESTSLTLTGFDDYLWIPGDWLSCNDCPDPVASPDTSIQYIVIAQNATGCISTDSIYIEVVEDTLFINIDTAICRNSFYTFQNLQFPADTTAVIWINNPSGCDTLLTIQVMGLDTTLTILDTVICAGTTFLFQGQEIAAGDSVWLVTTGTNGCDSSLLVRVSALPAVTISLSLTDTISLGETVTIQAGVFPSEGLQLLWQPEAGLSCTDCPNPEVNIVENTSYTLTATDSAGCSAAATISIIVLPVCNIFVPNAFSPDDNGINDIFFLMGGAHCVDEIAVFRLYDRWGELILEKENIPINDPAEGWNGKYKNKIMPTEVYVWYAEVIYIDGRKELFKGDITLIR